MCPAAILDNQLELCDQIVTHPNTTLENISLGFSVFENFANATLCFKQYKLDERVWAL